MSESRLWTLTAAAVIIGLAAMACEAARDANLPQESVQKSPPQTVDRLLLFRPATDPKVTDAWSRLRLAPRADRQRIREELADLYDQREFRAMASFVRAANSVTSASATPPVKAVLAPRDILWACNSPERDAGPELAEMDRHLTEWKLKAARDAGRRALQADGPTCALLLETAVPTLGLAATAYDSVPASDFELALRTFITADVELNLRRKHGDRSWPYQLAAIALINYDPPAALVAIEASRAICVEQDCSTAGIAGIEKTETHIRSLFK